jgi:hypothetical protein
VIWGRPVTRDAKSRTKAVVLAASRLPTRNAGINFVSASSAMNVHVSPMLLESSSFLMWRYLFWTNPQISSSSKRSHFRPCLVFVFATGVRDARKRNRPGLARGSRPSCQRAPIELDGDRHVRRATLVAAFSVHPVAVMAMAPQTQTVSGELLACLRAEVSAPLEPGHVPLAMTGRAIEGPLTVQREAARVNGISPRVGGALHARTFSAH